MKYLTIHGVLFTAALLIALPAVQSTHLPQADARPGSILGESRESSDRSHNMRRNRSRDRSSSRSSRSSSDSDRSSSNRSSRTRTRTSRNRNVRPSGPARATGNTRESQRDSGSRTTTRRRTTHSRPRTTTRRSSRNRTRIYSSSHTTVHHNHHSGHHRYDEPDEPAHQPPPPPTRDTYWTLGLGIGGFAAPQITDTALPGTEFNLGVGVSGDLFGFEVGFLGSGFTFDPYYSGIDIALMGLSGDVRVQPSFGFLEPFIFAGLGGFHFQDAYLNETAAGGALRFGTGVDLRIQKFALSLRYMRNYYGFVNDMSFANGLGAQTESVGVNFTMYF